MGDDLDLFDRGQDEGFNLERNGPNSVSLSLWGTPDWEKIGRTHQITMIDAEGAKLGPKPEGHDFPALRRMTAMWSKDLGSWLRGSQLRDLEVHRPTQATLDALKGVPLRFLRLQSVRWANPVRWPRLNELEDLWFILCKDVDLTGVADLFALRSVRIDSLKRLAHLEQLGAGHRLRQVQLEDVRAVDDPTQLWNIKAEEVSVWGRPATSPWIVEALRSLTPEQSKQLATEFLIDDTCMRLAAADGDGSSLGPISDLEEDGGSLTFDPVSLPTAEVLEDRGVRSTGDVWTELVTRWWPELARRFEMDPDGDLFAAYGDAEDLKKLQEQLEPLLADEAALTAALKNVPLDRLDS